MYLFEMNKKRCFAGHAFVCRKSKLCSQKKSLQIGILEIIKEELLFPSIIFNALFGWEAINSARAYLIISATSGKIGF
jgi:hypothetical protein